MCFTENLSEMQHLVVREDNRFMEKVNLGAVVTSKLFLHLGQLDRDKPTSECSAYLFDSYCTVWMVWFLCGLEKSNSSCSLARYPCSTDYSQDQLLGCDKLYRGADLLIPSAESMTEGKLRREQR